MLYNHVYELNMTNWDVFAVVDGEDVHVLSFSSTNAQEDAVIGKGRTVWCEDTHCCQVRTTCSLSSQQTLSECHTWVLVIINFQCVCCCCKF